MSTPQGATFPLTHAQQLLWAGQQLQPQHPLYNMALVFRIHGEVDINAFSVAFQTLVASADAMRIVIHDVNGSAKQSILESATSSLQHIDLSNEDDPSTALERWAKTRSCQNFDLGKTLYDSALIRLGSDDFAWYFNQHHLVTDAWSMAVIFDRMAHFYGLATNEGQADAANLPQFLAHVVRDTDHRESQSDRKAQRYWRERLAQSVTTSRFYRPPPAIVSGRTERVHFRLNYELSAQIRKRVQSAPFHGFTSDLALFRFFCAALLALLHRLGGQELLSLGVPSHNRSSAALKSTVGLFIELYPLRVAMDGDDTLLSLANKVAIASNELLLHARPGALVGEHHNAYDVVLNYITARFGKFDGFRTESNWVHSGYGDRAHRLRLQVQDFDRSGCFHLHFDVSEDCFSATERQWLIAHFMRYVQAYLGDCEQRINDVSLLDRVGARQQAARGRGASATLSNDTVIDRILAQALHSPQQIAIDDGQRTLTYSALGAATKRVRDTLLELGVQRGDVVALAIPRSIEAVVAILGVMQATAAFLPIEVDHPPQRVEHLLNDSGARCLLRLSIEETPFPTTNIESLDIRDAMSTPHRTLTCDGPHINDIAYIIYTSGSTGLPKGVVVEHKSFANYIDWASRHYTPKEGARFALFSPLSFDLTLTSIFVPLTTGGTIVVYPPLPGQRDIAVRRVVADQRVNCIKLTPVHLRLIQDMDFSRSLIRTWIVGGEDFPVSLARSMHERLGEKVALYNEYGPTEGTVACTIHRYDPRRDRGPSVPIGSAIDNVDVYVLDRSGHVSPCGVVGELHIGGIALARGYHAMEALTAGRFVANPYRDGERMYRTGDLAYWDEHGVLHYIGREDGQVKVLGVRIETAEVESVLSAHPAVLECVVDVFEDAADAQQADACRRCGLDAAHPEAHLDADAVCQLCRGFDRQKSSIAAYFGDRLELTHVVQRIKRRASGKPDCMMLLSGGKDSTFALCQLVEMGLTPLVFTLDNGFISDGAKANIQRVVEKFGLELVVGETPKMNEIFVDSLNRFSNVCNGCFKTIYTLSMKLALERGISTIVTGLSRGQIFDTRLAGLRQQEIADREQVERTIIEARKAYHRMDDAVSRCLDVSHLCDDKIFEDIEFVDFYRYSEATLDEMLRYLEREAPWIRPSDTGRSTNCRINELGIHVHQTERGYHNYALPYSWDVRLGHKDRDAASAELRDDIDIERVNQMLDQIGYHIRPNADTGRAHQRLAAWYVPRQPVDADALRTWLNTRLPSEYIPSHFVSLDALPVTANDKVDRAALPAPNANATTRYIAPSNAMQHLLAGIWSQVLGIGKVGVHDNFFDLGGDSILNIQIVANAREQGVAITPQQVFDNPTVASLAAVAKDTVSERRNDGPISGRVNLTPIQRRFFAEFPSKHDHFSQVALLDLETTCNRQQLTDALALLLERHDVLRSRFVLQNGVWIQTIQAHGDCQWPTVHAELQHGSGDDAAKTIDRIAHSLASKLDLKAGICIAAAYFEHTDCRKAQLLLVIHHLVVDGVSWWVLAQELGRALHAVTAGETPNLGPRSASWRQWSEFLATHEQSSALQLEVDYWAAATPTELVATAIEDAKTSDNRWSRLTLDATRTRRLLQDVPGALRAQVPEVLIAALLDALSHRLTSETIHIDVEAHGRDAIDAEIDVLRSVGWFTNIYPVAFRCSAGADALSRLRSVKETLRAVPRHGIGYGLLRYPQTQVEAAQGFTHAVHSTVLFNYMGQWDRAQDDNATVRFARPITLHSADSGLWLNPLTVDAVVFGQQLIVDVRHRDTHAVNQLAGAIEQHFINALSTIIEACNAPPQALLSPSDFPHADLGQGALDELLSELDEND